MNLNHKRNLSFCFILFFLVLQPGAFAQFARFRHITMEEGLTHNYVSAFAQDKKGFLWICTPDGLNRYDGDRITTFKASLTDSNTIPHNNVRHIYIDNDNILWGATGGGGMFKMDLRTGRFKWFMADSSKEGHISHNSVSSIIEYEPGKLYISTYDGLNVFDKKTEAFTVYKKGGKNDVAFLSNNLRYTTVDREGHFWFGHPNAGVTEYDPKTKKCTYYTDQTNIKLRSNSVRAVFCDSKGLVWVSCWAFGTSVIDKKNNVSYSADNPGPIKEIQEASLVSQFFEDRSGNIWFARAERGAGRYAPVSYAFSYFENNKDDPETISDNTIFSIFQDRSGLMWFGTWKGGANILDPRTLNFGYYKHDKLKEKSLNNNSIFSFCPKSEHEMYVGTGAGVNVFNSLTKTFTQLPAKKTTEDGLRENTIVVHIFIDQDSSIWLCTFGAGLFHYFPDKDKYKMYVPSADTNSLSFHTPIAVLRDKKKRLWIGTEEGLDLYNPDKDNFTRLKSIKAPGVKPGPDVIASMLLREDGKIWIGTVGTGLYLFDPDTRISKLVSDSVFPVDAGIISLHTDGHKDLWIGTNAGIYKLDTRTNTFKSYRHLHPLFGSIIAAIEEDNNGFLWFSNSNGMCCFNPVSEKFILYSTPHGVQGKQFCYEASSKDAKGYLYFGGMNGMNTFDPGKITLNTTPPSVVLTDFTALNQPYALPHVPAYTEEITLSHKDYFFEFDFAAMDFTNPSKNTYAYKLEGFNDKWVNIGTMKKVSFTNLDPGTYTLLLKAANNDGFWGQPTKIKLTITPPFWRTTWFYLLCLLTLILLVYSYIKWRERRLREEKTALENKVEARTAELKIEKQKVEAAHKDIKDSINYAKKIQEAILPEEEEIRTHLKEYFILYKPKDIVAGDFYWFYPVVKNQITEGVLIAAADCTGHGVPGAFMSMIGSTFLNEIVKKGVIMPNRILDELNINIRRALKQNTELSQSRDGMDIALCYIDFKNSTLYYSGANRPCVVISNGELRETKPDKFPIGGLQREKEDQFTLNEIKICKGDMIYLFSDGYADQFGGPEGKKFMYRQLKDVLLSVSSQDMTEQKRLLDERMNTWKAHTEQVDDILIMGIKI
jgi:ligand-binding sensor domain-containing protein/serine phosphatase RsbU (regulator of sigma subunit)